TDRLPGEATRDRELVDAVRHLLHRRIGDDRRTADNERGGKVLALASRLLPVDVHVLAEARRKDADARRALDLPAVVPLIADARLRVLGEPVRARRVGPVVETRRGDRDRELGRPAALEEAVAGVHLFVHRSGLDDRRRDAVGERALPARRDLVRGTPEPGRVDVLRRGEHADAHAERRGAPFHRAYVLEQEGPPVLLGEPTAVL